MKKSFSILLFVISITSCSLFQETTSYDEIEVNDSSNNSEEVYVFDETSEVETNIPNNSKIATNKKEIAEVKQEVTETISESNNSVIENVPLANTYPTDDKSTTSATVYSESTITSKKTVANTSEEYTNYSQQFYLQLGAFSTLKRAEKYAANASSSVPFDISVMYNSSNSLYMVRSSSFATKGEAEAIRGDLKRRNIYKDAFIVTE